MIWNASSTSKRLGMLNRNVIMMSRWRLGTRTVKLGIMQRKRMKCTDFQNKKEMFVKSLETGN